MNSKEFKTVFGKIAETYSYVKAFGGWYKESDECLNILELQKSSFSNSYYLNIKIFIQGIFEKKYVPNKELIKIPMGHITKQIRDQSFLDLDKIMEDDFIKDELNKLFQNNITPFVNSLLTKDSIREMEVKGEIVLLPAVKMELNKKNKIY